jgi:hypothetical protein
MEDVDQAYEFILYTMGDADDIDEVRLGDKAALVSLALFTTDRTLSGYILQVFVANRNSEFIGQTPNPWK